jgi:hypothetical protein
VFLATSVCCAVRIGACGICEINLAEARQAVDRPESPEASPETAVRLCKPL